MLRFLHSLGLLVLVGCGARSGIGLGESQEAGAGLDTANDGSVDTRAEEDDVPFVFPTQLAVGQSHSCYLRDGSVRCWGLGDQGQLGTGRKSSPTRPMIATTLPGDVVQLSTGYDSTSFRRRDGSVGYVGPDWTTGGSKLFFTPSTITSGARQLYARGVGAHNCYRSSAEGEFWCWGENNHGQAGSGEPFPVLPPRPSAGLSGASDVIIGGYFTCGLIAGIPTCAGFNDQGQLGDGTTKSRASFSPVLGLSGVTVMGAGLAHACAIQADAVVCWGYNERGQLGDGTTVQRERATPVVSSPSNVSAIGGGLDHTCALLTDGRVSCWGGNAHGQLGDGSDVDRPTAGYVLGLSNVIELAVGGEHNCARLSDESVWCWGANTWGQIGDGTKADRTRPVRVAL